jgi:hypothetical protein
MARLEKRKRAIISAFIAVHLVALYSWAMPPFTEPWNSLRNSINNVFRPYLLFTGIWQGWDMFAPNPLSINTYLVAEVTLKDGSVVIWPFPRMEFLGFFEKYYQERWRKWAADNVRLDKNSALWPDAARYVARLHARLPSPPAQVKLIRHWADIPPPARAQQKDEWKSFTFFTYEVLPRDLEGEARR